MKKRPKIGLALGAGAARGLVHIGVLKVLHKNKIYPDYLAGTSMGAVIAALYAAGKTPEEIEAIAKTTDWKSIVDFTFPKAGLLQGKLIEEKIKKLLDKKKFHQLDIPLQIVAYNLTKHKKAIFAKGDVARAVRASIGIPGIVKPALIGKNQYIDGMIVDPTPFDLVKEMGADIVIAVDLYKQEEKTERPEAREKTFADELMQKFVADELRNLKNYLFPDFWPNIIIKSCNWLFDKILYPARVMKIMIGKEAPEITKVLYETLITVSNNFARERIEHAEIQFKIQPTFDGLDWLDFDKVEKMVAIGEEAMQKELPRLKKLL
jgi:NTE family protein